MKRTIPSAILTGLIATVTTAERPNIILILADDLGYGDPGCYGGQLVPTPAIDALAKDGVRFTDGYVTAPVSAPSRCGLMTGAYNQRFGIQWNDDRARYRVKQHALLPQALKAARYRTGHIGKWNIGSDIANCFDETRCVIDWEADYIPDASGRYIGVDDAKKFDSSKRNDLWWEQKAGEEYLTDRLGRQAIEFIDRNKNAPFFLYLAFNAVHSPWQAKATDRETYAHIKNEPLRFYAAMLASLDANVGRVMAKLKECGLDQDTLVIFLSDNGPAQGPVKTWPEHWPKQIQFGSAGPLNGHKGQFLEGGLREPYIMRWPARLKAGQTYRQPVSSMDVYATCCAAAQASPPAGTILDGVDLVPWLTTSQPGAPHDILFWKNGDMGAVRKGDWKLVITAQEPRLQLFNLSEDIGETCNRAVQKADIADSLFKSWNEWGSTLPPRANPMGRNPASGHH